MSIPFTQYCLPNGRKLHQELDCSPECEAIAKRFIAIGGRYECEVLTTGEISFTAVKKIRGEEQDVAIVLWREGDGVPSIDRVDELVRQSEAFIGG